jgi:uncharacterized protein YdeI (BOF family)
MKHIKIEIDLLVPDNQENTNELKAIILGNLDNEILFSYSEIDVKKKFNKLMTKIESEIKNANIIS